MMDEILLSCYAQGSWTDDERHLVISVWVEGDDGERSLIDVAVFDADELEDRERGWGDDEDDDCWD